jgi:4-diphosphocytidyl-2-C-methyl-D-erythritol kinase
MILFPPAKINLGLSIVEKRNDGYHELETCMLPIPFYDILEILPSENFSFFQTGFKIPGIQGENLCEKAFRLMKKKHSVPNVMMHLRKQIPMGAGLGGGSSDAAYVLKGLNEMFQLNLAEKLLEDLAAELGSDCPFFIKNEAQMARGRGEKLTPINLTLRGYYFVLLNPGIHVGTKEAYAGVTPTYKEISLDVLLENPISAWQNLIINDFEASIFVNHPKIAELKSELLKLGALYASMSGSGSSVFGVFKQEIDFISCSEDFKHSLIFNGFI